MILQITQICTFNVLFYHFHLSFSRKRIFPYPPAIRSVMDIINDESKNAQKPSRPQKGSVAKFKNISKDLVGATIRRPRAATGRPYIHRM